MPPSITFWDARPQRSFRPGLKATLRTAMSLDVAVAFITRAGVEFFLEQVRRLGAGRCRLTVSVQFPTDLGELCRLSREMGDRLHIHLGSKPPRERSGKSSQLMHSKVVWVGKDAGQVAIFVGSHNWTSTALDGLNMEASVGIETQEAEAFAGAVKDHLDACFAAGVVFDPNAVDYYRAIQARLYPTSPRLPDAEGLPDFIEVPGSPAVVIHAEDHRGSQSTDLLLYLPLDGRVSHEWFNTVPTTLYLYLYPPGTLLGQRPPAADPTFFEGRVEMFSLTGSTGQRVDAQITDLVRPVLTTVPSGNMPTPTGGVTAQVVAELRHRGTFALPVYSEDRHQPGVRVDAHFEEAEDTQVGAAPVDLEVDLEPVSPTIAAYYTPGSVSGGHFVFHHPRPTRSTTIQVPGGGFYRVAPDQTVREYLIRRYEGIRVEVNADRLPPPYLYRVWFVFRPPHGTHAGSGPQPSLFD